VSALADPMLSPSLDHLPFMGGGADVSLTVEQQIHTHHQGRQYETNARKSLILPFREKG
jgi:hypothetical protein